MKKTIFLIMLLLLSVFAFAANEGNVEPNLLGVKTTAVSAEKMDVQVQNTVETQITATEQVSTQVQENVQTNVQDKVQTKVQEKVLEKAKVHEARLGRIEKTGNGKRNAWKTLSDEDKAELKERVQARSRKIRNESKERQIRGKEVRDIVHANRVEMRVAMDSLREIGDSVGGLGKNISEIVKEYNAELKETLEAEGLIQNRSRVKRFFAGGDVKAAERIENQVSRNKEKIERIESDMKLIEDEDILSMMEEHLAVLENEQERLETLSTKEKGKKGLFGWLWK